MLLLRELNVVDDGTAKLRVRVPHIGFSSHCFVGEDPSHSTSGEKNVFFVPLVAPMSSERSPSLSSTFGELLFLPHGSGKWLYLKGKYFHYGRKCSGSHR